MGSQPQKVKEADEEKRVRQQLLAKLEDQVMRLLGQPSGSMRIQIHPLWDSSYRVNVLTGSALTTVIAHSYFLKTDDDGNIVTSQPTIRKTASIF